VDLRTARPFDYHKFTMVGALKGAYNDLAEDVDPRASFLISNTFDDERFGFLFSAAYSARKALEEGSSTVRWDQGSSVGGFLPTSTPDGHHHRAGQFADDLPPAHSTLWPARARAGASGPHGRAAVPGEREEPHQPRRVVFEL
jgi:hypothetical protein